MTERFDVLAYAVSVMGKPKQVDNHGEFVRYAWHSMVVNVWDTGSVYVSKGMCGVALSDAKQVPKAAKALIHELAGVPMPTATTTPTTDREAELQALARECLPMAITHANYGSSEDATKLAFGYADTFFAECDRRDGEPE